MKNLNTDTVMKELWYHLLEDFEPQLGQIATLLRRRSVADPLFLHSEDWPSYLTVPNLNPSFVKRIYQLQNLCKRYVFKKDVLTPYEREKLTIKKFVDTQIRINSPLNVGEVEFAVLQRARRIVKSVLGYFPMSEFEDSCRFGRKSCYQVPFNDSFLHVKCERVTGSEAHIRWFRKHLRGDNLLSSIVHSGENKWTVCDALPISLVPKSYKALRIVRPPTLIGSYYTQGIGRVLRAKLWSIGLDISSLQKRHRRYVKDSSVTGRLVTADLTSASDSITKELLLRLLPNSWYHHIMMGRTNTIVYGGVRYFLNTTMTMGDGDTFPLQTLVFYSLVKAIGELQGRSFFVSVYGDDLVYSRHLHDMVKKVFPRLHLILNMEKTYADGPFRESCGSDCYCGVDVRPFQPEGRHNSLGTEDATRFLYQLYNGLMVRWDKYEIPSTLRFLEDLLLARVKKIHQVPPDYPDTAGIRTENQIVSPFYQKPILTCAPDVVDSNVKHRKMAVGFDIVNFDGVWQFDHLSQQIDSRVIKKKRAVVYYWDALRQRNGGDVLLRPPTPILKWRRYKVKPESGRRVTHTIWKPMIASKGQPRFKLTKGYVSTSTYWDALTSAHV